METETTATCGECRIKMTGPNWGDIVLCPTHTQAKALHRIAERLMHIDARLRLRSPATRAEIKVWAELRESCRAVLAIAKAES